MNSWRVIEGDALTTLRELEAGSAQTCVTSPPYFGLRDYGHEGQIGLEATPDEYVQALVVTFREVRRVLSDDGTLWLNLGDSYAGSWGAQSRPPGEASTLDKTGAQGIQAGAAVRRLTPTECERLQALPDGWTVPTGPSLLVSHRPSRDTTARAEAASAPRTPSLLVSKDEAA